MKRRLSMSSRLTERLRSIRWQAKTATDPSTHHRSYPCSAGYAGRCVDYLKPDSMTILSGIGKIHILSGVVVSRIAAGEVIERPAAVVKELIDNSVDAGSARIIVEVTDGGREMIRVTDDGKGMSHADAPAASSGMRPASCARKESVSIETMGFRGEALPSIASVSRVRVRTASGRIRSEPNYF